MWLRAPNIACTHGFSTRHGGYSTGALNSLNLGGSIDAPERIQQNREKALQALGLQPQYLCTLKQVHGDRVCVAEPKPQEGDALVSNSKTDILAISIADCYPILFHDPVNAVIGAAHAGWRGTLSGIAGKTVAAMCKLGADPSHIQVAIGQGICKERFQVGAEVSEQFRAAAFPQKYVEDDKIDLIGCNLFILQAHSIPTANIWAMGRCTYETDFFSHRRDQGLTGRMWGVISLNA